MPELASRLIHVTRDYSGMSDRAAREKAFWDEAYRVEGPAREKHLWSKFITEASDSGDLFGALLGEFVGQRILTLGGGVDTVGVSLSKNNNRVISLDISPAAAQQTAELARRAGVERNLSAVVMNCEEMVLAEKFDLVVCKRALHHMNLSKVVARVHDSLVEGGRFIAEEPVCLLKALRWIHRVLPFHPEAPQTDDEVEFTQEDLALIGNVFREVRLHYMDCLTRESIKYCLWRARARRLLRPLGRLDSSLVNDYLTPLKYLSTYVLIQATK
jgi:2-polyprenyl-3-methyl-5-hydroxy-6-metoxy-1,4-benzoquinol methylase